MNPVLLCLELRSCPIPCNTLNNFNKAIPCRKWQGVPRAREHGALRWVRPGELARYPMPPADRPLIAILRDWL